MAELVGPSGECLGNTESGPIWSRHNIYERITLKNKLRSTIATGLTVLALGGMLAIATPPPAAQAVGCNYIKIGPTKPWYQCINLLPGTGSSAGCYSRWVWSC